MSQTRAQRKKISKKLEKRKNLRKLSNIKKALSSEKYRLDVLIDGTWRTGMKYFRKWEAVEVHRDKTEAERRAGADIAAGRVYNLHTGKLEMEIAGSEKAPVKGNLPDVLADKPESAKKGLIERAKDLIIGE